ncbi:dolichyl-diphosphooligosaccharide-- glycosyltransferase subunit DAD1 [Brachionus plicatilis]|uniref:Dolichyl-diphosphooligosaccharide--protein glycosyltransferase subunit DAD1 n=1 Tax=Brachionus plicatilis TaxID=10195 RepID=A0A3M7Q6K2_BRAPC|nr:dolichyl-diphosphooligosaccharide-- glycosyltransferase subunit DAD1 [Brachionus plicatilis]
MSKTEQPKGDLSLSKLFQKYQDETPKKVKLIDAYMFCILLTGIIQFAYCCLVGTFPFNAFLSGFISTVASFVLAASYRIQINKQNSELFSNISAERSFADFIFAHVILHLVVVNFIG